MKKELKRELNIIVDFLKKISPIHKMENYKKLGYGINWSITSDGMLRQITLKILIPFFFWKRDHYDIEWDRYVHGWQMWSCLICLMFAFAHGQSDIGKQTPVGKQGPVD